MKLLSLTHVVLIKNKYIKQKAYKSESREVQEYSGWNPPGLPPQRLLSVPV